MLLPVPLLPTVSASACYSCMGASRRCAICSRHLLSPLSAGPAKTHATLKPHTTHHAQGEADSHTPTHPPHVNTSAPVRRGATRSESRIFLSALIVALSGRAGTQRARAPGRETLACRRARAATSRSGDATRPRSRSRKVTKWRVTRTRARYIQYHTRFWRHDALQAYYSVGTAGP